MMRLLKRLDIEVLSSILYIKALPKDELAGRMFDDELEIAYAVIHGVEVRGQRGNYTTQRLKFNSN